MKLIYSFLFTLCFTFISLAQTGVYVKYNAEVEASGDQAEMLQIMMADSNMEVASNSDKTWVKTKMGTVMTMSMEMDIESNIMTMFMTGMTGETAFRGNPDTMKDEDSEEEDEYEVELVDGTKEILGVTCKKAIAKNKEGNLATYWYTEDFERPKGMEQMPNNIPGLCLEFEVKSNGLIITYTATEFNDKAQMKDYNVVIPENVEIQSYEDLMKMGMGKN